MAQLHKRFSDEQIRVLFQGYCQGQFSRVDLQEMLDIGKTRFFALLSEYRRDPETFTIVYQELRHSQVVCGGGNGNRTCPIAGDGPGKLITPARRRQQHGRHDFPIDAAQSSRSSSRTDDVHVDSTVGVPAGMALGMNVVHPPLPILDSVGIAWPRIPRIRDPPRSGHVAGRPHGPGRCGECHLDRRC